MRRSSPSTLVLSVGMLCPLAASAGGDKLDKKALLSAADIPIQPARSNPDATKEDSFMFVDETSRLGYIARGRLWLPMNLDDVDTRAGRQVAKTLPNDSVVECEFRPPPATGFGGTTNKFKCELMKATDSDGNDIGVKRRTLKVRYNSIKTYVDVITTRLAWALGLGSDIETPVRQVICHGCTKDPFHQREAIAGATETFTHVSLEDQLAGVGIAVKDAHYPKEQKGETTAAWYWDELDYVKESYGRATRAQVDALKLFAVFLEHNDSKAIQNRLVCLHSKGDEAGLICEDPYMYVHDFGNTLGSDGMKTHPLDLKKWENAPIWKEGGGACVAKLHMIFHNGSGLSDPTISEAGRKFLADRLAELLKHEALLHDMFDAAHIDEYDDHGRHYSADDWVRVFKARANQIIDHSCPK